MARKPLFGRLPKVWQRLDNEEILERFLEVWDQEFDLVRDKIESVLALRDIDRVPDKYLPLLGILVGHVWRSDQTHAWNRKRIKDAIRLYSYKRTDTNLSDLVAWNGGLWHEHIDQASRLLIVGAQGLLNGGNSFFLSSDYWHDGAHVLYLDDQIDADAFLADMANFTAAGEVWFYYRMTGSDSYLEFHGETETANSLIEWGIWRDADTVSIAGAGLCVDSLITVDAEDIDVDMEDLPYTLAGIQQPAERYEAT